MELMTVCQIENLLEKKKLKKTKQKKKRQAN